MSPAAPPPQRANRVLLAMSFIACLAACAPRAAAVNYTASDLFTLGPPTGFNRVFPSFLPPGSLAPGRVVGFGGGSGSGSNFHALFWDGAATPVDLNPANFRSSEAHGISGGRQVGHGAGSPTGFDSHALLWSGTAASAIDLHPANFITSFALGVGGAGGAQQVGYGTFTTTTSNVHALLWTGAAASVVDLHPTLLTGFTTSSAWGTDGTTQVGYAYGPGTNNAAHAMLWTGTPESAVDLHPPIPGLDTSLINAMAAGQQVGHAVSGADNFQHAILWNGTAASAVDLTPGFLGGFTVCDAYATNGTQQIGFGQGTGTQRLDHALVWSGSADSVFDLQTLLPSSFQSSRATAFDAAGDIFGLAVDSSGNTHAVEWAVPEPGALPLLSLGALEVLRCERRRRRGHARALPRSQ